MNFKMKYVSCLLIIKPSYKTIIFVLNQFLRFTLYGFCYNFAFLVATLKHVERFLLAIQIQNLVCAMEKKYGRELESEHHSLLTQHIVARQKDGLQAEKGQRKSV